MKVPLLCQKVREQQRQRGCAPQELGTGLGGIWNQLFWKNFRCHHALSISMAACPTMAPRTKEIRVGNRSAEVQER